MHGLGLLHRLIRIRGRVHGEMLVVAQRVDGALGKEARTMYRAVVDDLYQCLVFICYRCIVDVDQPIRTAGE